MSACRYNFKFIYTENGEPGEDWIAANSEESAEEQFYQEHPDAEIDQVFEYPFLSEPEQV